MVNSNMALCYKPYIVSLVIVVIYEAQAGCLVMARAQLGHEAKFCMVANRP